MILDTLDVPIVLAPLAGGPSTPELTAAVRDAGGLGFLAAGYLTADALRERMDETRALTTRPFGVNLFVPGPAAEPSSLCGLRDVVARRWASRAADDDDWEAKLALARPTVPSCRSRSAARHRT